VNASVATKVKAKPALKRQSPTGRHWLTGIIILLLLVNIIVLARSAELISFPGEVSDTELLKAGASALADYYEAQAVKLGVDKNTAVREALAKFKFEISKSGDAQAIANAIGYYGRATAGVLEREQENRVREAVLGLINADPGITAVTGQAVVTVSMGQDRRVIVEDPGRVLSLATIDAIQKSPVVQSMVNSIDVEVAAGKANVITARTMQDRVRILRDEVDSLRLSLDEIRRWSGRSAMTGRGIVVSMFDAEDGFTGEEVVQENDIRDIVNELFAAGAQAIEVGGQRLVATSSVRSAGSQVLVDQRPIPLNPVVIKAIGDPEVLDSSLDLISNSLKRWGIRMEVERFESLSVSAYRGN
jgi:uncharacterized protein YlxW (UPF0749 family)